MTITIRHTAITTYSLIATGLPTSQFSIQLTLGSQITKKLTRLSSNADIKFKAIGSVPEQLTCKANGTVSALSAFYK